MTRAIVIGAVVTVLLIHLLLSRQRWKWLGALVPLLWIGSVLAFAQRGNMSRLIDYVMAVVGLCFLLWIWLEGQKRRGPGTTG